MSSSRRDQRLRVGSATQQLDHVAYVRPYFVTFGMAGRTLVDRIRMLRNRFEDNVAATTNEFTSLLVLNRNPQLIERFDEEFDYLDGLPAQQRDGATIVPLRSAMTNMVRFVRRPRNMRLRTLEELLEATQHPNYSALQAQAQVPDEDAARDRAYNVLLARFQMRKDALLDQYAGNVFMQAIINEESRVVHHIIGDLMAYSRTVPGYNLLPQRRRAST